MKTETQTEARGPEAPNFVESALRLGGKSDEEARSTASVDRADEQVEDLFSPGRRTADSPIHRVVWGRDAPLDLFLPGRPTVSPECERVMGRSLEVVRRHKDAGTLIRLDGKIAGQVLDDLAGVGYWGLLIDPEYGGSGAPFSAFAGFLTRMSAVEPMIAGLASVHGCIGAVDPLRTFGSPEQKRRYLPMLARGDRLSGFALTEPGAGSDLTALRTRAEPDGDDYVITGEKLFITNAAPGRTIGLVCRIDDRPAVLIADLPDREDEHFRLSRYGLFALRQAHNNGLRFRGFRVPRANLLRPARGDGLTIAYHGLNRGRVALCATAAGSMRVLLADLLPWAHFRRTYGEPIASRELVRRRIGRLAGLIAGCDALVDWCARLLDEGYRGEMECIVAKVFGSEAQKEAAIELYMKTHGGRAFLRGHRFGENVHDYLAPCIYEGEGEMLGLAFFKSLIKEHGRAYFEPIGRAAQEAGIRSPNPTNPAHAWALRRALVPYAAWWASNPFEHRRRASFPGLPRDLAEHARFALGELHRSRLELSATMARHQLRLADRQCRMAELSGRIQSLVVILVASLWAGRQDDRLVRAAAMVLCSDLRRAHTGRRPGDDDFRAVSKLGEAIAAGGYPPLNGIEADAIRMPYAQEDDARPARIPATSASE